MAMVLALDLCNELHTLNKIGWNGCPILARAPVRKLNLGSALIRRFYHTLFNDWVSKGAVGQRLDKFLPSKRLGHSAPFTRDVS